MTNLQIFVHWRLTSCVLRSILGAVYKTLCNRPSLTAYDSTNYCTCQLFSGRSADMSKRKSKAAAPRHVRMRRLPALFRSGGPELLQAEHPRLRLHTGRGAQAALAPRARGCTVRSPMPRASAATAAAPRHNRGLHARAQPLREGCALRKLHYHLADPPELISDCLRCKKPECTNCLERKLRTAPRKAAQAGRRPGLRAPRPRRGAGNRRASP